MPQTSPPTISIGDSTSVSLHQLIYEFKNDTSQQTTEWILTDIVVTADEPLLELSSTDFEFTKTLSLQEFKGGAFTPARTSDGDPVWGY